MTTINRNATVIERSVFKGPVFKGPVLKGSLLKGSALKGTVLEPLWPTLASIHRADLDDCHHQQLR